MPVKPTVGAAVTAMRREHEGAEIDPGRHRAQKPLMTWPGMSCLALEKFCFEVEGLMGDAGPELVALARGLVADVDVVEGCRATFKHYAVFEEDDREQPFVAFRAEFSGSGRA